ncbi:MAG: DEAD/DEAH box helicase, partial [Kiritimatiellaeota bacterium]|nr:DEAD/DEAH box helicase [Kiritimatiellota bacterium]
MTFPVDPILPTLAASLAANRAVVLQAPPGSGKTTRVAPFLLNAPWLNGRKILMLEPRRLAARGAAAYMARQRHEPVGATVGYHIRLDRKCGPHTRIEILTEGLLTQRLLNDPELADIGLIIFDEFHERSLAADTGLALTLDVRGALRPDLRIVVMSATLQPGPIARHLGNADIHTADARMFPVETRLCPPPVSPSVVKGWRGKQDGVVNAVLRALREETGSILVFLPGEGEIRRTLQRLRDHLSTSHASRVTLPPPHPPPP